MAPMTMVQSSLWPFLHRCRVGSLLKVSVPVLNARSDESCAKRDKAGILHPKQAQADLSGNVCGASFRHRPQTAMVRFPDSLLP
jgi:hypothetical protein